MANQSPRQDIPWQRFTTEARKVLTMAEEEARRFNHNYIGTEHLLLGLIRDRASAAGLALALLGVDLRKVRSAIEFIIGKGERQVEGEIGLTPRAKTVLMLSVNEAEKLKQSDIAPEHILLGLVAEGEGIAAGVLESLGVNLVRVRKSVVAILSNKGLDQVFTHIPWDSPEKFTLFSSAAQETVDFAREEAKRLFRSIATPELLLIALARQTSGMASRVLGGLGTTLGTMRTVAEDMFGYSAPARIDKVTIAPNTQQIFNHAAELAAHRAGQGEAFEIGTGDILLSLSNLPRKLDGRFLSRLNIATCQLHIATLRELSLIYLQAAPGVSPSQDAAVSPQVILIPQSPPSLTSQTGALFVSYSRADNTWCTEFAEELRSAGYDVWFDYQLHGGDDWIGEIERQILRRQIFILLLTPEALTSDWVQNELRLAQRNKRSIIPVQLRVTDIHDKFIGNSQLINAVNLTSQQAARLVITALAFKATA